MPANPQEDLGVETRRLVWFEPGIYGALERCKGLSHLLRGFWVEHEEFLHASFEWKKQPIEFADFLWQIFPICTMHKIIN